MTRKGHAPFPNPDRFAAGMAHPAMPILAVIAQACVRVAMRRASAADRATHERNRIKVPITVIASDVSQPIQLLKKNNL